MKAQDKIPEKHQKISNKMETSNLLIGMFEVTFLKNLTKLRRGLEEHNENFNKENENLKQILYVIYTNICTNLMVRKKLKWISSVQLLSHVRLCDSMDCSMPGLPVHHQTLEFT